MSSRAPTLEQPPAAPEPVQPQPRRQLWPSGAVLLALLVALAFGAIWLVRQESGQSAPAGDAAEEPAAEDADVAGPTVPYGDEPRANWDVTGVVAGDRLNVRAGPGVGNAVTATLAADTVELESTGRIARVDGALWREIVVPGDATGWVNARYLTETAPS